jgi:hypothetical protein
MKGVALRVLLFHLDMAEELREGTCPNYSQTPPITAS